MRVDDATWQAIIAETTTEINRMNGVLAEHDLTDPFTLRVVAAEDHEILITQRGSRERRAIARYMPTNELRKATIDRKGKCKISTPLKSWERLHGKTAREIMKGVKVADYMIVISSRGYACGVAGGAA